MSVVLPPRPLTHIPGSPRFANCIGLHVPDVVGQGTWCGYLLDCRPQERDKRIRAVKRAVRSEISVTKGDWRRHGLAQKSSELLSTEGIQETVPRIHCKVGSPCFAIGARIGARRSLVLLLELVHALLNILVFRGTLMAGSQ